MFYSVDGRIIQIDGRFPVFQDNTLSFEVFGPQFPWSDNPNTTRQFNIRSLGPNEVEINFSDGFIQNYIFNPSSNNEFLFEAGATLYNYQDGNTGNRIITLKFKEPSKIISIQTLRVYLGANFPSNIIRFSSLKSIALALNTGVENFPTELSQLRNLEVLSLNDVSFTEIPLPILNLTGLKTLGISSSLDLSKPFSETNFDKLTLLQNSLENLSLSRSDIVSFPQNIEQLSKLKSLSVGLNNFFEAPPFLPLSLEEFLLTEPSSTFGTYNNLSRLINLKTIILSGMYFQNGTNSDLLTIPATFSNLKKLKTFLLKGQIIDDTGRIDQFINSMYDLVNLNATKDASQDAFRDMSINNGFSSSAGAVPSGTYQQPTGFVLGSDNGAPASPQEKIWVMVNQYGHTWTYTE